MASIGVAKKRVLSYLENENAVSSVSGLTITQMEDKCITKNLKAEGVYVDKRDIFIALEDLRKKGQVGKEWMDRKDGGEYRYFLDTYKTSKKK